MEQYNLVMKFLKGSGIDRYFPCQDYFYELDEETGEYIPKTFSEERLLLNTNREDFEFTDYVNVVVETTEDCSAGEWKFNFSEYDDGISPIVSITADSKDLTGGVKDVVRFTLQPLQQMADPSRNLTGIKSVEVVGSPEGTILHDIILKNDDAQYTMDEIDTFIETGKYYILSRLGLRFEEVPDELEEHIYTAAAGYIWLDTWEYEARVMNDEQKNAMSYGKWLLANVNTAVDEYKKAKNIDDSSTFVQEQIVTSLPLRW